MEKLNKIEMSLMSQEEFDNYISKGITYLNLITYNGVQKFKSIRRAIKRNNVTKEGIIIPRRPFNNKANTSKREGIYSRNTNELKKKIYEQIRYFHRDTL